MKTTLSFFLFLALLSFSSRAGDHIRLSGIFGDMVYTLTSEGIHFKGMKEGEDVDLAIDWSTTNPDMEVYLLDENYNYRPFQQSRGSNPWHDERVVFEHIYPNVDLIIHPPKDGQLGYEFVVYPGGDVSQIGMVSEAFRGRGMQGEKLMASGLKAYQDVAGAEDESILVSFKKSGPNLGFEVNTYEFAQPLTISFSLELKKEFANR